MKRYTGINLTVLTLLAVLASACGKEPATDSAVLSEQRSADEAVVASTTQLSPCRDAIQGKTLSQIFTGNRSDLPTECQAVSQKIQTAVTQLKTRFPALGSRISQSDGQLKQTILTTCGTQTIGGGSLPSCVRGVIKTALQGKFSAPQP